MTPPNKALFDHVVLATSQSFSFHTLVGQATGNLFLKSHRLSFHNLNKF